MIGDRDYTLIIDQSGSMSTIDEIGGKSRWEKAQDSTLALAQTCEEYDEDGITVYVFSSRFTRYDHVTSAKVSQIFRENVPGGTTNLAIVLQDAINNYFRRKAAEETKPAGETILVVTDGEPDDRAAVFDTIINATHKMDQAQELAISLIQVGSDPKVAKFLRAIDDQLQSVGAKFDICSTVNLAQLQEMSLSDVLLKAIMDA